MTRPLPQRKTFLFPLCYDPEEKALFSRPVVFPSTQGKLALLLAPPSAAPMGLRLPLPAAYGLVGSPCSLVVALPERRQGTWQKGARPRNSSLPLAAIPLPPGASRPRSSLHPNTRLLLNRKHTSHSNPLAAPPGPSPYYVFFFPLAPGWAKYIRWEPSGLLPGNPSCGFH